MRFACVLATVALVACRHGGPDRPTETDDTPVRMRIAQLEATRGGGLTELVELSNRGTAIERALSIRALGRIGGPRARAQLLRLLADNDVLIRDAAASAIGVMATLDEPSAEVQTELTRALLAALDRASDPAKGTIVEAIGRAANASAQADLVKLLQQSKSAVARRSVAYAFARYGRRKIALDPVARLALIDAISQGDTTHAALYAFSRETMPPEKSLSVTAAHQRLHGPLASTLGSQSAETRALALFTIAKHDLVGGLEERITPSLLDTDWRVAVEAVRALAGDKGTDSGRDAVAAAMVRRFAELEGGKETEAQVVTEALRVLAPYAKRPLVLTAITSLARSASASTKVQGVTYGWIECLALAAMARSDDAGDLSAVAMCKLPDHLRLGLVAELIAAKAGTLVQRRELFAVLTAHADVRVRAAAMSALASLYEAGAEADRSAIVGMLVAAIGNADPILAGSAVDAAGAIYKAIGSGDHAVLDAAVIARARTEADPELAAALLDLVGTQKLGAGLDACRGALDKHPVLATAGATCLRELGEAVTTEREPAVMQAPAVDLAAAFGPAKKWVVSTTRGPIEIELDPTTAPWAVASIIALTKKSAYDKLAFHRVVPDFVVQGGDPTESGWGGPGYTLPAEPYAAAGFIAGGVGMADAGRDSAGSQWFVMHAPAPHLDARYTYVGRVTSGANVADALLIGDSVVDAVIMPKETETAAARGVSVPP